MFVHFLKCTPGLCASRDSLRSATSQRDVTPQVRSPRSCRAPWRHPTGAFASKLSRINRSVMAHSARSGLRSDRAPEHSET